MPKGFNRPKNWLEAVKLMARCPVCSETYPAPNAKLVGQDDRANKVHLTCAQCGTYSLVMVIMAGIGVSSVGIITDLSHADAIRVEPLEPISTDELITTYQFLKNTNTLSMDRLR